MRWSRGVGILALAIAAPGAAQAPQQLEVTFNEAIQRALQVQPLMCRPGAQRTSGAARTQRMGVFLPSVTLGAFASKNSAHGSTRTATN